MIEIENSDYPVIIGKDDALIWLDTFCKKNYTEKTVYLLCDTNTLQHCLPKIDWLGLTQLKDAEVLEVEPGERSKNIEIYYQLVETLLEFGADRNSVLINLGGGVVSDLGGFLASTFKRGIDFINVPTSLLGMVDASIGGKTGINAGGSKNQIGTFGNPKAVVCSLAFMETLPKREFDSGLAEMLKHILISDVNALDQLDELKNCTENEIERAVQIKLEIVQQDFKEDGLRKKLNYGHTFGHAIESHFHSSGIHITHGEAVLLGMLIENELSSHLGLLDKKEKDIIANWILSNFEIQHFINRMELSPILELLALDKKNQHQKVSFSLIGPIGTCSINVLPKFEEIEECLSSFIQNK